MHPLVTVHLAQSIDGRLALDGTTTALSTLEGQRSAHTARAEHDAVIVGSNTVRIDDPRLTVRHAMGPDPLRVILASSLDLPSRAKIFDGGRVLVVGARGQASEAARAALVGRGAEVDVVAASGDGLVSLMETLVLLGDRGIKRVLVEGGAKVVTSFFRERLVDRAEIEIAMRILGSPGTMAFGSLGIGEAGQAIELVNVQVERLGANLLVRADVARGRAAAT